MNRRTTAALVLLAWGAPACGTSHAGPGADAGRANDGASDGPAIVQDSGAVVLEGGAPPPVDGSTAEDAGGEAAANPCVPLGGACVPGAGTCYCSLGSGCTFDNADCPDSGAHANTCTADPGDIFLDAGEACCSQCQYAYDTCGAGASCFDAWTACNAGCGEGQCPVQCYAALAQ